MKQTAAGSRLLQGGLVVLLAVGCAQAASAQAPASTPPDAASIEAFLADFYDVISGPMGQPRDLVRLRSMFVPGARLIPTVRRPSGEYAPNILDIEGFIRALTANSQKQGFFERGIASRIEQFGRIASVFSTYETRRNLDDRQPFMRGINSFQLLHDGTRWLIVTMHWQGEDADNPLPGRYADPHTR